MTNKVVVESPSVSITEVDLDLHAPGIMPITPLEIPTPKLKGRVYIRFAPRPLTEAGDAARREANQVRPPDDDPFSALFFILLAKRNWDVRVRGLHALLSAYPDNKKPYRFQLEGMEVLAKSDRVLLADEMGLGKTIQAILAMRAAIHAGKLSRVLVCCPKSLMTNWYMEIAEWAPELSVTIAHGVDRFSAIRRKHHVYITNYESVQRLILDQSSAVPPFDLLIVDEVQNLKRPHTQRAKSVASVIAQRRWGLTGTPLENSFEDYRGVWRTIDPGFLDASDDQRFLAATKSRVLRRTKAEVLQDLPKKLVKTQFVKLDGEQLQRYEALEQQTRDGLKLSISSQQSVARTHIFGVISELKQLCVVDSFTGQGAKLDWLEEQLEELHPHGVPMHQCEKMLVFSQYPQLLWGKWKLGERFKAYNPLRLDGSLTQQQRQSFVQRIQSDESCRLGFMSFQAGGTGLTLTRASQVVFLDSWWNPAVMDQAAARIHRIGQERICTVTALVAKDTIDERILKILERKRSLFEKVMLEIQEGRRDPADLDKMENALTIDDLLEAIGLTR